jgi:hypothetical protein
LGWRPDNKIVLHYGTHVCTTNNPQHVSEKNVQFSRENCFFYFYLLSACAQVKETGRIIDHTTPDAATAIGHGTRDETKAVGEGVKRVVKSAREDEW